MTGHHRVLPALLLIPGLVCDEDLFAEQVTALSDVADVLVSDVAGGSSIEDMARAALAVAPERFVLGGLSLGGYVAWEVLRQAPGRVTALALLDTSARPDSPAQTARRRELVALGGSAGFGAVLDELWPYEVAACRRDDVALRRRFDAMCGRHGTAVFRRQQEAIIVRPDSRPDLARVEVPTLVLCGREDALTPLEVHLEMADAIPDAELVVLDDCGHLSTWERPEQVSAALRELLRRAPSLPG